MSPSRDSNFYDSRYLTEYYDLWSEANKEALDTQSDAPFYFQALQTHLASAALPPSSCVVLDIGTGTGRVLFNLTKDALSSSLDLSTVDLIGVDKESAMIERAQEIQRETHSMSRVRSVTWTRGEAATLTTSGELDRWLGGVDMILFGVGSVSHLADDGEPLRFFTEIAKLLRPDVGIFYLSIQNDLISERSITRQPPSTDTWSQLEVAQDFSSKLYPNLVYKQFPVESSTVIGPIRTDKYRFEIVTKTGDGKEELVETNAITVNLRIWNESEIVQWAAAAGLTCVATDHTSHETFYMLKKLTPS